MGFKDVIKTAFPFISAAATMGGPLGVLAANTLSAKLGVTVSKPEDIENVLTTSKDPELLAKLKEAEQDFQLKMTQLGFDNAEKLESIAASDRASARAREIAVRDRLPMIMAIAVTAGFFTLLGMLIFHAIPDASREVLFTMTGVLGTAWASIVSYYFGSSSGSAKKSDQIAQTLTK